MCHVNCRWENRDGDCKVRGRLPDNCRLRDDKDGEDFNEPEYDPVEEMEKRQRRDDRFLIDADFFTMPNIAELAGLRRVEI